MGTPWWKKKKVWGTIIGSALLLFGDRLGFDGQAAREAALLFFGGVTVEGIVDAAAVLASAKRKGD